MIIQIDPWADFTCENVTTISTDSNTFTVESNADAYNSNAHANMINLRLEITNGAELIWDMNDEFYGQGDQDVYGGGMPAGEMFIVLCMYDLVMYDVGVRSVTDESFDFGSHSLKRRVCLR